MLQAAIQNNIDWCAKVCETHDTGDARNGKMWGALTQAPTFYPDIVTSSTQATAEDIMAFVGDRKIGSIKDSFSNIDMTPYGFEILFEAEWIYHVPAKRNLDVSNSPWQVIHQKNQFEEWNRSQGLTGILKQELLTRKDVKFFARKLGNEYAGFSASCGSGVVGISNVAEAGDDSGMWPEIIRTASAAFPGKPLVGYESESNLRRALAAGWVSVGQLRVWINAKTTC